MDFLHTRSALLVYLHTIWQLHMFNEFLLESKKFFSKIIELYKKKIICYIRANLNFFRFPSVNVSNSRITRVQTTVP